MLASLAIFFLALGGLGGSFQPTRILLLVSVFFFRLNKKAKTNLIGLTPLIKAGLVVYVIWIIYGLLTLVWASDPIVGLNSEIIVMCIGMSSLLFFPYYYKNDISTIKKLANAWAWSCIVTLPIAIFEIVTFRHFFYVDEERALGGIGFEAPFAATFFGNYNGYSTVLCFYYPFLLISFINEKRKWIKAIFGVSILTAILVILVNTSRGAMVTFAIITLFAVKLDIKRIVITIASLFFVYTVIPSEIREAIDTVISYRFSDGAAFKDDSRSGLMNAGLEFLKDSYGFGIGAGSFEKEMLNSSHYSGMVNPHNIFIEVLSQYGIIIFILFMVWLLLLVKKIWQNKVINFSTKKILFATILCIPIIGAINSAALGYTYWWIYFTTLALMASIKPKIKDNG